jgi:hypothetical protein
MQPKPTAEPDAAVANKILNTGYGIVQIQEDGTYKYLPVWVHTKSGVLLLNFKKADAPVDENGDTE